MPDLRALEAAIAADPDDPAGYVVYADALQAAGDPRGDLIALQVALTADPAAASLVAADLDLRATLRLEPAHGTVRWAFGFWRELYLTSQGPPDPEADAQLARLLASPSARFLRVLYLGAQHTPGVLDSVATCAATLRELTVALSPHGEFTDEDLPALAPLTGLRQLTLSSCTRVTEDGMAVLRGMRELTWLLLAHCTLTDAMAELLAELPLQELHFRPAAISAGGMRALAQMPLRRLHLGTEMLDDAVVAPLVAHPTLTSLDLYGAQLTAAGVGDLGSLPRLRRLVLTSSGIAGSDLAALAPLADRLESLAISHSDRLSDAACATLAGFERLAFLDIAGTAVTGAGLRALRHLGNLQQLAISFLPLGDDDLAVLADLPGLRCLDLAYTKLSDRTIDTLLRLPRLERLDLAGTRITEAGLQRLTALPALTDLGLSECDDDALAFAHARAQWAVSPTLHFDDQIAD